MKIQTNEKENCLVRCTTNNPTLATEGAVQTVGDQAL